MRSFLFVPVVLVAAAWAASAQTAPPKPPETVTVVGQRPTDGEMVAKIVRQFVEIHAARSRKNGLVTRAAPSGICPATMGLPPAYDDFVSARIAAVAKEIGAKVGEPGRCVANVEVMFTNDPQGVVNKLAQETNGVILGMYFTHDKGSIIHVYRAIQAWYVTGTKRDPNAEDKMTTLSDGSSIDNFTVDTAYGPSAETGTGSRIRIKNSGQIVNALIVADLNKTGGGEIGPIADYVALLALSQPASYDGCNALPSILDLMSSGCPGRDKPKALTESDIAYLKALYTADIATSGYTAQENVANDMDKNLVAPAK